MSAARHPDPLSILLWVKKGVGGGRMVQLFVQTSTTIEDYIGSSVSEDSAAHLWRNQRNQLTGQRSRYCHKCQSSAAELSVELTDSKDSY